MVNAPIVKRCKCGREFTAAEWAALPLVGTIAADPEPPDPLPALELRNCPCGSTIALAVNPPSPES